MDAVETFNSLPAVRLEEDLLACCAAPSWGAEIVAKRPYRERSGIVTAADHAARRLSWPDVLTALSAHPRIGERATGGSTEAGWSRGEQSTAAGTADDASRAALVEVNRAYEEKFGHVFLIFASGRTQAEILAAARARLGNDEAAERAIVAGELRKIALRRLERVLDAL
ncbi:2-oxo-4-hydroxy-4-carboxy-5-ureidoimidazoline decarboxylase [Actinoplanes sp. TBRC 11911]|uniref:2-oxo-4-hydroxy-4-carboxy-5-ureidoimidazoline decarboxylase n=1 Tax=Actinoplanes sp. TBRC 11911 TaxID=2729386 RepID=UPI00145D4864|nr:2-oxo-4-hydroxy-4-carboxy-5-ureidoimidazoline decarboxylase [Actinoplanes sp. TBRC 11911]NMO51336.1 2-oxo-4-hydroxy-4-carboxy-5-ureidoimidazoline decarboxylase [Actinoplanes sp. TBRC 11911]